MKRNARVGLVLLPVILAAAVTSRLPRIPQDPAYHQFADRRGLPGIPNVLNVASNIPLIIVGTAGLLVLRQGRKGGVRLFDSVLFAAVAFTGFGSAHYHWNPVNNSLVWDRLPLAVTCMTFLALMIGDRISIRAAKGMFVPLTCFGAGSVIHWWRSELGGAGDLRIYGLVQFLPLLLVPVIVALFPSGAVRNRDIWNTLGWYLAAKGFELFDRLVFGWTGWISGHTAKHLCAGAAAFYLFRICFHRARVIPGR